MNVVEIGSICFMIAVVIICLLTMVRWTPESRARERWMETFDDEQYAKDLDMIEISKQRKKRKKEIDKIL